MKFFESFFAPSSQVELPPEKDLSAYSKLLEYNNAGIYQRDGQWQMFLENKEDAVPVPPEVAQIVRVGLYAQQRFDRVHNRESYREYRKTAKIHCATNCHKIAHAPFGLSRMDQDDEWASSNMVVNQKLYRESSRFHTHKELEKYMQGVLHQSGESLGFAQIFDSSWKDDHVSHSFLVGVTPTERVVCFEKQDYKMPFRITNIEQVFHRYRGAGYSVTVIPYSRAQEIFENFDPIAHMRNDPYGLDELDMGADIAKLKN